VEEEALEEKTDTVGCQGSPKQDALIAQLSELNQRVRLYASQAWQMPFAYLAATGLTLLRADSSSKPVAIMLVTSTFIVFGLAAVLAVWNMMKRARELVDSIKEVERSLLLQESVKYQKPLPFYIMLVTGIAANAIFLLHNLGVV
jgi:hypothetical protein